MSSKLSSLLRSAIESFRSFVQQTFQFAEAAVAHSRITYSPALQTISKLESLLDMVSTGSQAMSQFAYQQFYYRNRPHIHPPGATLFVTFRLAGSVPQAVVKQYQAEKKWLEQEWRRIELLAQTDDSLQMALHTERLRVFHRRWFRAFEDALHEEKYGPTWLKEDKVAQIVHDSLHYLDGKDYRLDAYCLMSNHVHVVLTPSLTDQGWREVKRDGHVGYDSDDPALAKIMQSLKGYTAREANRLLQRRGAFWEHESYDHVVRDAGEYDRIVAYVLNNPVKAGLVREWKQWRWNWRR